MYTDMGDVIPSFSESRIPITETSDGLRSEAFAGRAFVLRRIISVLFYAMRA